jgi:hypothetical protein
LSRSPEDMGKGWRTAGTSRKLSVKAQSSIQAHAASNPSRQGGAVWSVDRCNKDRNHWLLSHQGGVCPM